MAEQDYKQTQQADKGGEETVMEEDRSQDSLITLANTLFLYKCPECSAEEKETHRATLMAKITEQNMTPFYIHLCTTLGWMQDEGLVVKMSEENKKKLEEFEAKEKDAKEHLGETEVRDVRLAKAEYLASIGEKVAALEAYDATDEKSVGEGGKIDLLFAQIRLGLFWTDREVMKRFFPFLC